ncbi:hypothetical protein SAMN05216483_6451 [Streptomyces sp. 2131.1]|nr:hypothetical protein SAMN05216483_6451 [Streptomyces sp. 2131.1]
MTRDNVSPRVQLPTPAPVPQPPSSDSAGLTSQIALGTVQGAFRALAARTVDKSSGESV